jgi:peptide-methionine (S)-S-oxide reductase
MAAAMTIGLACARASVDYANFPEPKVDLPTPDKGGLQEMVIAGGCFWCTEGVFEEIPGVADVISGYAGDTKETADYKLVSRGETKHAEAIKIVYDPRRVSYGHLLKLFFSIAHDPTTLNQQGNDVGPQYRSAIFYASDDERRVAQAYIAQLTEAKVFPKPIVTTLEKLDGFYEAESYHQDYTRLNPMEPYIRAAALPKKEKAKKVAASESVKQPATQPAQ